MDRYPDPPLYPLHGIYRFVGDFGAGVLVDFLETKVFEENVNPWVSNIITKTYTRVHWYFKEIFPMFVLASFFVWLGQITGLFDLLVGALGYPISLLGLPDKAAVSFLFGFFRRDYGAAGFYDMKQAGLLTGHQLLVASVTLTLFLPCVVQFLMNIKERGAGGEPHDGRFGHEKRYYP